MALPPVAAGGVKATDAEALPGVASTAVGAPGTTAGPVCTMAPLSRHQVSAVTGSTFGRLFIHCWTMLPSDSVVGRALMLAPIDQAKPLPPAAQVGVASKARVMVSVS